MKNIALKDVPLKMLSARRDDAFCLASAHDDIIKKKTFSELLALCEGNPPVICGFPSQRPVMQSFDVLFDLHLKK